MSLAGDVLFVRTGGRGNGWQNGGPGTPGGAGPAVVVAGMCAACHNTLQDRRAAYMESRPTSAPPTAAALPWRRPESFRSLKRTRDTPPRDTHAPWPF
ncbi:hypothetical protein GCM10010264_40010 [Streptomyces globisporus]|nr:hypothetical protein GCM10010264_40010 [Streptomyces globisporus]